jgi:hypothetical protein
MDDPYDLVLAMFGVAVAAVMLVAGELYLVTMRPDPPETYPQPSRRHHILDGAVEKISGETDPSESLMHVPSSLLSSFVTLFFTIGPVETAVIFAGLTSGAHHDAALPFDPSRLRV